MQVTLGSNDWQQIHKLVDRLEKKMDAATRLAALIALTGEVMRDTDKSPAEAADIAKELLARLED